jgi:indole-3-glycerol phosphate synthase
MSTGVLGPILEASERRLVALRERDPEQLALAARAAPAVRDFLAALLGPGVAIIAEMKRRSPSGGQLRPDLNPSEMAAAFSEAGAAAISVLTEADSFGGSLEDLVAVRRSVGLPVLRKDFVVDPLQVAESRAAGADALLLIVRALDEDRLRRCLEACHQLQMTALVEVHDQADMEAAAESGAKLIGINNRDLDSLTTDPATTERLAAMAPSGAVLVSESGIHGPADLARLSACGVQAVLVGESLMRSSLPGRAVSELVQAGAGGPATS